MRPSQTALCLEFLKISLDLAITMAKNAVNAKSGSERQIRTTQMAWRIYETVMLFQRRLVLTVEQVCALQGRVQELEGLLAKGRPASIRPTRATSAGTQDQCR